MIWTIFRPYIYENIDITSYLRIFFHHRYDLQTDVYFNFLFVAKFSEEKSHATTEG